MHASAFSVFPFCPHLIKDGSVRREKAKKKSTAGVTCYVSLSNSGSIFFLLCYREGEGEGWCIILERSRFNLLVRNILIVHPQH